MIKTRKDLEDYLKADSKYYQRQQGFFRSINSRRIDTPISDQWYTWRYVYALRHVEYHYNNGGLYHRAMHKFWLFKLRNYSYKTGFQVEPNTCGKGLYMGHFGYVIVNSNARIGDNCLLSPGVVIGQTELGKVPIIGNNCKIWSGAKITGKVRVGDNVVVAPNSCVTKDVPSNCVVAGIPAKVIKCFDKS